MFNLFSQDRNNQLQSYLDVITIDSTKLQLSKLAIEKAVGMIANAIAKSEIVLQDKNGRKLDKYYYQLNVRPNDNETGTDFWKRVVKKMLTEEKCLICRTKAGKYYRVYNCTESDDIFRPRTYSDITVECDGKIMKLDKTFTADDMIVLKYENEKIRSYLRNVVQLYDETLTAVSNMKKFSNTPKFKFITDAAMALIKTKDKDGKEKTLTKDEYVASLRSLLESNDLSIMSISKGLDLEQLKIDTNTTSEDISKLAKEINSSCAMAFDISDAVFFGNITEKSDATNEFITYAVSPPAEVINDSLNAKLVGESDYVNGERIFIWLARFKHVDVIDKSHNLMELRSIGFTLDEVFEMIGYPTLNTEFSTTRYTTKNFAAEDEKGGDHSEEK